MRMIETLFGAVLAVAGWHFIKTESRLAHYGITIVAFLIGALLVAGLRALFGSKKESPDENLAAHEQSNPEALKAPEDSKNK